VKHCRKDPTEPECLAEFRAANPTADWETDFRSQGRTCYETVRRLLRYSQGFLCAYCEVKLTPGNEQIAHFHPKSERSGGHNWALDWDNLWLACLGGTRHSDQMGGTGDVKYGLPENRSCDEATEDVVLDGVILRPNEIPAFPRLFRYRQEPDRLYIEPDRDLCQQKGIPIAKVQLTIDRLNLNCSRLAEARLPVHKSLEAAKKRLRKSNLDPLPKLRRLAERHLGSNPDGYQQPFFTVARWNLRKVAEDFLGDTGFGE
jgi:uncharacterized protein (TIGR02646 family)